MDSKARKRTTVLIAKKLCLEGHGGSIHRNKYARDGTQIKGTRMYAKSPKKTSNLSKYPPVHTL